MTSRVRVSALALAFGVVALMPAVAAAQSTTTTGFGVKAGVNSATIKADDSDSDDVKRLWGAAAGVFIARQINNNVGVQLEGLFSQKGAKADAGDDKNRLTYLDVPFLVKVGPTTTNETHFHVFAGPQVSFKLKAEVEEDGETFDIDDQVKGTDVAVVVGAMVERGRIHGDVRYAHGFSDIAKAGDIKIKNRVISVNIGVRLK